MADSPFEIRLGYQISHHVIVRVDRQVYLGAGEPWIGVRVEVVAGRFEGSAANYVGPEQLQIFRSELENLYQTLKGKASLGAIEGGFDIEMQGDGLGHIQLKCEVNDDVALLRCVLELDQTLLPEVINQVKDVISAFPELS